MDDLEKIVLEMQGDFKVIKQTIDTQQEEITEIKAQTKLNVKDIQSLNINIVELSKDMKNYSNIMKDLTEQLKKITQEPAEFNEKIKVGAIVGIITFVITTLANFLLKK